MKSLAIIPARGGSKRIPRKNIKDFLGKPIISYSIESAIKSKLFDEIMVSTDDPEITEIAIKYGAKVPFVRSKINSDDFAGTYNVIEEVINEYKSKGVYYENICCIYPCAPFISENLLKLAYSVFIENQYDTVFPIVAFSFPIQRALIKKGNKIMMINKNNLTVRSQDLEKRFHDAGQFYWCKTNEILANKKLLTSNSGGVIISELQAQDIDNDIDWKLAELKYKLKL